MRGFQKREGEEEMKNKEYADWVREVVERMDVAMCVTAIVSILIAVYLVS
jgi:hypothetical protein